MEIKASIPEKRLPYAVLDNVEICSQVMTEEPSGYQGKARPGLYAEEIVKRIWLMLSTATLTEQSWVYNVEVR